MRGLRARGAGAPFGLHPTTDLLLPPSRPKLPPGTLEDHCQRGDAKTSN